MIFKTAMLEFFDGFMEENKVAGAFSSLFRVEPNSVSDSTKIELEITRSIRLIASDVARGSGDSHVNFVDIYSNKEFTPPLYSEKSPITADMLNKKLPGKTKYGPISRMEGLAYLSAKAQAFNVQKIRNAIEKQAVQAMTTGIITLNNGASVDYQKKATLDLVPSTKWDANGGDSEADIGAMCDRIHKASKKKPNRAAFSKDAYDAFMANIIAKYNNAPPFIAPGMLNQGPPMEGFTYQGTFNFTGYRLDLYTYDDFYEDSSGTAVDYLGTEKVVIFNAEARRVMAYAATEVLPFYEMQYAELGMPQFPELIQGQITPFALVERGLYYAGVQSAPLTMPVEIDAAGTISDMLT